MRPSHPDDSSPLIPNSEQAPAPADTPSTQDRGQGPAPGNHAPWTWGEREKQIDEDYEWCLHDPEVRQAYGGQVVVAYRRKIWGAGSNHTAAWEAASREPGCPPREDIAVVVVPPCLPDTRCP
jgi:hypothetical protein